MQFAAAVHVAIHITARSQAAAPISTSIRVVVEVRFATSDIGVTDVEVCYALVAGGVEDLEAYRRKAFVEMIDGCRAEIAARLVLLLTAPIR